MHPVHWQNNYLYYISSAYLAFQNNLLPRKLQRMIVRSDTDWFDIEKIDNSIHDPVDTYIAANSLRWRVVDK